MLSALLRRHGDLGDCEDAAQEAIAAVHAVRAHLLDMLGRDPDAVRHYREAARLATSWPERRYLNGRAERLDGAVPVQRVTSGRSTTAPAVVHAGRPDRPWGGPGAG